MTREEQDQLEDTTGHLAEDINSLFPEIDAEESAIPPTNLTAPTNLIEQEDRPETIMDRREEERNVEARASELRTPKSKSWACSIL